MSACIHRRFFWITLCVEVITTTFRGYSLHPSAGYISLCVINAGRFIMFSVITNIYNKKTKGPTLMELFTATGKLKKFFLTRDVRCVHCCSDPCLKARITATVKNVDAPMLTHVWQELEYRIDVCRVTRGAHIENL
jgi:hypothetical protein